MFFDPKRLFLGRIPKFFVTTMTGHHIGKFFVLNSSHGGRRGGRWGQKIPFVALKKGHFGQSGPENGSPSAQTGTYQKSEGIQSYLRTWESYDLIESGPSEPKKLGFMGVA